jgi:hypothetical protein
MKRKPKSLPKLKADLQLIFNSYIRRRDEGKPCISCNEPKPYLQAGHFYPTQGYDGLRFDEHNVNGECSGCNCFDSAHLIFYAENLLNRIGKAEFEALKSRAREYKTGGYKWHRSDLIQMIEEYKEKLSEL